MKILIDMNLSPDWCTVLQHAGHDAVHWSTVGVITAPDTEILQYARTNGYVVFTQDLDFGTILAATQSDAPSVLQLRGQNGLPDVMGDFVVAALERFAEDFATGALVTVDAIRARARILPI